MVPVLLSYGHSPSTMPQLSDQQNSQTTSYPAIPAESMVSVPPRKEQLTSSWGKSVKHHLGECMDSEISGEET